MNIFYAPPDQIEGDSIELTGQEAAHASKALRYSEGDEITVVDGRGGWYEGIVARITRDACRVQVRQSERRDPPKPHLVLSLGIIKKRDRLEFAVEKAVELGASEILLFRSGHSVKENVRIDRLESIALSAMKQSLRAYLPEVQFYKSLTKVLEEYQDAQILAGSQEGREPEAFLVEDSFDSRLLIVGPEGGLSPDEIGELEAAGAGFVRLSSNRLRAETAAVSFLSLFQ